MMNLGEGIKRIYIVFSCLCLLIGIAIGFTNMPSPDSIGYAFVPELKEAIVSDLHRLAKEEGEISSATTSSSDWSNKYGAEFVSHYCGQLTTRLIEATKVCKKHAEEISSLTMARVKYSAQIIGIAIASARRASR
jgi:hypothetical protein